MGKSRSTNLNFFFSYSSIGLIKLNNTIIGFVLFCFSKAKG